jgi:hypothetical protein
MKGEMKKQSKRMQVKGNQNKLYSGIWKGQERFGDKIVSKCEIKVISCDEKFFSIHLSI